MFIFDEEGKSSLPKAGIKNFRFTSSGTNGKSHRANAAKKKRQHENNVRVRADLYSSMQGEKGWKAGSADLNTWHTTLKSLSAGTA